MQLLIRIAKIAVMLAVALVVAVAMFVLGWAWSVSGEAPDFLGELQARNPTVLNLDLSPDAIKLEEDRFRVGSGLTVLGKPSSSEVTQSFTIADGFDVKDVVADLARRGRVARFDMKQTRPDWYTGSNKVGDRLEVRQPSGNDNFIWFTLSDTGRGDAPFFDRPAWLTAFPFVAMAVALGAVTRPFLSRESGELLAALQARSPMVVNLDVRPHATKEIEDRRIAGEGDAFGKPSISSVTQIFTVADGVDVEDVVADLVRRGSAAGFHMKRATPNWSTGSNEFGDRLSVRGSSGSNTIQFAVTDTGFAKTPFLAGLASFAAIPVLALIGLVRWSFRGPRDLRGDLRARNPTVWNLDLSPEATKETEDRRIAGERGALGNLSISSVTQVFVVADGVDVDDVVADLVLRGSAAGFPMRQTAVSLNIYRGSSEIGDSLTVRPSSTERTITLTLSSSGFE